MADRDISHRLLLFFLITLFVAKPLFPGDDPGLLGSFIGTPSLIFIQMVLSLLVAWFLVNLFNSTRQLVISGFDFGFLGLLGVMVISSAFAASFKYRAWFSCWEFLTCWILFFLTRQLATDPTSQHFIGSALLATAVTVGVSGLFQMEKWIPRSLEQFRLKVSWANSIDPTNQAEEKLPGFFPEFLTNHPNDPSDNSPLNTKQNFLPAYLSLFIPGLILVQTLAWKHNRGWWVRIVLGLSLVLPLIAFLMTSSLLSLCSIGIVISFSLLLFQTRRSSVPLLPFFGLTIPLWCQLAFLAIMILLTGYAWFFGFLNVEWFQKLNQWQTNLLLIIDHPLLGVGPANFSREYSPFAGKIGAEPISSPGNFLLEVVNSSGIPGGILLLLLLFNFYSPAFRGQMGVRPNDSKTKEIISLPWECYLGGLIGLLLGLLFKVASQKSKADLPAEGIQAIIRSLVWFISFAALESLLWSRFNRWLAWMLGVSLCLVYLFFESGFGNATVSSTLWITIGLVVCCQTTQPTARDSFSRILVYLAIPVVSAIALLFLVSVLVPTVLSQGRIRQAVQAGKMFQEDQSLLFHQRQLNSMGLQKKYLEKSLILPFLEAAQADPGNPQIYSFLAWTRMKQYFIDPDPEIARLSILDAQRAQQLDPLGTLPLILEAELRKHFARPLVPPATPGLIAGFGFNNWVNQIIRERPNSAEQIQKGKKELVLTAAVLERAMNLDPTNAQIAFLQAEALAGIPDLSRLKATALQIKNLDSNPNLIRRALNSNQRDQINYWLQN